MQLANYQTTRLANYRTNALSNYNWGWSSPGGLRGLQNRCEALNRLGWVRLPSTPA